jgi:hypothetical protein
MGSAKTEIGSILFLPKCVGFEPLYKVGPINFAKNYSK